MTRAVDNTSYGLMTLGIIGGVVGGVLAKTHGIDTLAKLILAGSGTAFVSGAALKGATSKSKPDAVEAPKPQIQDGRWKGWYSGSEAHVSLLVKENDFASSNFSVHGPKRSMPTGQQIIGADPAAALRIGEHFDFDVWHEGEAKVMITERKETFEKSSFILQFDHGDRHFTQALNGEEFSDGGRMAAQRAPIAKPVKTHYFPDA